LIFCESCIFSYLSFFFCGFIVSLLSIILFSYLLSYISFIVFLLPSTRPLISFASWICSLFYFLLSHVSIIFLFLSSLFVFLLLFLFGDFVFFGRLFFTSLSFLFSVVPVSYFSSLFFSAPYSM